MPRRPRVVVPDVPHHITQRGNNRQAVFASDDDRQLYLHLLTHHAIRSGMRILGYCLMTNHVHLIAVPQHAHSLSRALRHAHAEYAQAFNRAASRSGHLWQNRFFSCPLEGRHVEIALRYVDLNPVRAGLVAVPWHWPWSSARVHSVAGAADPVLDAAWIQAIGNWDFAGWRGSLAQGLPEPECAELRRATYAGEPWGSKDFVASLEQEARRRLRVFARGRPPQQHTAGEAQGVQGMLFVDGAGEIG